MRCSRRALVRAASAAAAVSLVAAAALAQQDAVKARQAAMKGNGQALKSIVRIIRAEGDPADVIGPARKIAAVAGQIPALFPPGTDQGKTEASPAIWRNFADFRDKAADLGEQARMLAAAGEAGDLAIVRAQLDKVVEACTGCHKAYRHQR